MLNNIQKSIPSRYVCPAARSIQIEKRRKNLNNIERSSVVLDAGRMSHPDQANPYSPTEHGGPETPHSPADDLLQAIREREYSVDNIIRVAARLYRLNFADFAGAAAVHLAATAAFAFVYLRTIVLMIEGLLDSLQDEAAGTEAFFNTFLMDFYSMIVALGGLAILSTLTQFVVYLYTVIRAGERLDGIERPPLATVGTMATRFVPFAFVIFLTWLALILLFAIPLALMALEHYLPGVFLLLAFFVLLPYFMVHFAMIAPVVGIERSFGRSLVRCFQLLRGRFWKSFGVFMVILALAYVGSMVTTYPIFLSLPGEMVDRLEANPDLDPTTFFQEFFHGPTFYLMQIPGLILGVAAFSYTAVVTAVMYVNYSRPEPAATDRKS